MNSFEYSVFKPHDSKYEEIKHRETTIENVIPSQFQTYSLIIPAYNEGKRIGPFLEHLNKYLSNEWEVIVVCDGSDNTAEVARSAGSRFNVLEFKKRLGKGGAVKEGFNVAHGNIIGYVDADGAISFNEIAKVFGVVNGSTQVSVGSRWVNGSQLTKSQPILRVILGRLYHYMSFALLGIRVKDTQCGVKAFEASTVKTILNSVTLRNLSFDTAILYHCHKKGTKIAEVPIVWKDVEGSKVRPLKTAFIMFLSLVGLKIANSKKLNSFETVLSAVRDLVENA